MEFILVIGFIIFVINAIIKASGSGSLHNSINAPSTNSNRTNPTNSTSVSSNRNSTTRPQQNIPKTKDTFRPKPTSKPKIPFNDVSFPGNSSVSDFSPVNIDGLHDAFTGAPLDKRLGLNQCTKCKVFYHNESVQILREANGSACVACQAKSIVAIGEKQSAKAGRDHDPNVVTLSNYREYVGSVITFEGKVEQVLISRRGIDYAVMFENKSWTRGFKLVFFGGSLERCGGSSFVESLRGKTIKVRGLLHKDPTFGYEIIISERSMILDDGFVNGSSRSNHIIDLPF